MIILNYLFLILCILWVLLIILKQFNKNLKGYIKYDVFALIPSWTLFAPRPAYTDYKVCYRDLLDDGTSTDLKEIILETSNYSKMLWGGQNREKKLISIICKESINNKKHKGQAKFFIDRKTQMFRNYCKYYEYSEKTSNRQIVVLRTFGYLVNKKEDILFVTNIDYRRKEWKK